MHKLKLELESLIVESFATVPDDEARGTVQAFETFSVCFITCAETYEPGCSYAFSCNCPSNGASCASCVYTCGYTCANTCAGHTCENCPAPTDP